MAKLNPEFLKHIKGRNLLFESDIRFINESIEWRKPWEIGIEG